MADDRLALAPLTARPLPLLSMNLSNCRQVLECAGRARRRRRFGFPPNGQGIAESRGARAAESKAAWRFASRRTPKESAGALATVVRSSFRWCAPPLQRLGFPSEVHGPMHAQ